MGIVNAVGSTIARETDYGMYLHAGPEIGVASTKAFTGQLVALSLFTLYMGRRRHLSVLNARSTPRDRPARTKRTSVLEASGADAVHNWIVAKLLNPKFDDPAAQMPRAALTPAEVRAIASFLTAELRTQAEE